MISEAAALDAADRSAYDDLARRLTEARVAHPAVAAAFHTLAQAEDAVAATRHAQADYERTAPEGDTIYTHVSWFEPERTQS